MEAEGCREGAPNKERCREGKPEVLMTPLECKTREKRSKPRIIEGFLSFESG